LTIFRDDVFPPWRLVVSVVGAGSAVRLLARSLKLGPWPAGALHALLPGWCSGL